MEKINRILLMELVVIMSCKLDATHTEPKQTSPKDLHNGTTDPTTAWFESRPPTTTTTVLCLVSVWYWYLVSVLVLVLVLVLV